MFSQTVLMAVVPEGEGRRVQSHHLSCGLVPELAGSEDRLDSRYVEGSVAGCHVLLSNGEHWALGLVQPDRNSVDMG